MPKFKTTIDTDRIPIKGLVAESGATAPANPVEGLMWNDTANKQLKVYLNGAWQQCDNQGVAASTHIHTMAQVTGLQDALANRSLINHTHALTDDNITGVIPLSKMPVASSGNSSSSQIVRADDARLSDSRPPNGAASGDLSGTYPAPTIRSGAVTDTKVAAANKDGVASTPSLRTLGTGARQALPGDIQLDQITGPLGTVTMNNQRLSNLGTPTSSLDAANKFYVDSGVSDAKAYADSLVQGLDIKDSVKVATTTNLTTISGVQTIDGVQVAVGDRVLVKNQTDATKNGIYIVSNSTWTYAPDWQTGKVTGGAFTFAEAGTSNAGTGWVVTNTGAITVGTTSVNFSQFSGAGSINAGTGLSQDGNTLNVGGTTNRIVANADNIDIASTYVGQTSITTLGAISTGTWNASVIALNKGGTGATTASGARANLKAAGAINIVDHVAMVAGSWMNVTHNLGTEAVVTQVYEAASYEEVILDVKIVNANTVAFKSDVAYGANTLMFKIVG